MQMTTLMTEGLNRATHDHNYLTVCIGIKPTTYTNHQGTQQELLTIFYKFRQHEPQKDSLHTLLHFTQHAKNHR